MEEIELANIFNMFWSRKLKIILIIIISVMIGGLYTIKFTKPIYNSSTTLLLVSSTNSVSGNNSVTVGDITINSKLVSTYINLIKSNSVISDVIRNLNLQSNEDEIRNSISVNFITGTQLIEIIVKNENPETTAQIANETTKVFTEKIKELYNINNVQVVNEAQIPNTPSNINYVKTITTFFIIGVIISTLYVFIANISDLTIKTSEDIERRFKLPVLAATPINEKKKKTENGLIVNNNPKSPISEIFRTLRTNIQFINKKEQLQAILITSTLPKEGKSWISSNLAVTFAQAGKKVILIDSDMRRGRQHTIFDILPKPGLSNYLSNMDEDEDTIEGYIQETKIKGLYVMSAGDIPPNPSELLVSEKMLSLVEEAKEIYDIIILDGPPTQLVTDAVILSTIVDSTIIVAASKETKKDNLNNIIENIKNVGGKIAGVVLNKVSVSAKQYKQTYYYGEENKKK